MISFAGDLLEGHGAAFDAADNLWMVGRCRGTCNMGQGQSLSTELGADGRSTDAVVVAGINFKGRVLVMLAKHDSFGPTLRQVSDDAHFMQFRPS